MQTVSRFTEMVRSELAGRALGPPGAVRAEFAALARAAGTITLSASVPRVVLDIETGHGVVARRAHQLLLQGFGVRPELLVREPRGLRRSRSYRVRIAEPSEPLLATLGLTSGAEALGGDERSAPIIDDAHAADWLRGIVLAGASLSSPGRTPHLEIRVSSRALAEALRALLVAHLATRVLVDDAHDTTSVRVVVKSGEAVGALLVLVGAARSFLTWDESRLRRQLRNDANRLANADAANLRRSTAASAAQVDALRTAIASHGWSVIDEEGRALALARLTNPEASLAELGRLLDPPVGKSTVQRRLRRLLDRLEGDADRRHREGT